MNVDPHQQPITLLRKFLDFCIGMPVLLEVEVITALIELDEAIEKLLYDILSHSDNIL